MTPIDQTADRAVYQQLADLLREQIRSGELAPGALIPSEPSLEEEHHVSRTTVRAALGILEREGLIVTERGKGRRVRRARAVIRRAVERYRYERDHPTGATSFTYDQGAAWDDYRLTADFEVVGAEDDVALSFGVPPGTPLLRREFVFFVGVGPARQTSVSYLLHRMVRDTDVEDPANEPWKGGTIAQLASLGVRVTHVREEVSTRMPTPEETRLMAIPGGTPVFAIRRTMFAGPTAVEVAADIVIPGSDLVLAYDVEL